MGWMLQLDLGKNVEMNRNFTQRVFKLLLIIGIREVMKSWFYYPIFVLMKQI